MRLTSARQFIYSPAVKDSLGAALLVSFTLLAHFFFACSEDETFIAHILTADGAAAEFRSSIQIGVLKGDFMFRRPYHLPGFIVFYDNRSTAIKKRRRALPSLAADVAKKAERKRFPVGMISGTQGDRRAHTGNIYEDFKNSTCTFGQLGLFFKGFDCTFGRFYRFLTFFFLVCY